MTPRKPVRISWQKLARAKKLTALGLVHVTGLPISGSKKPIQANRSRLNTFLIFHGSMELITRDGEVWIGSYRDPQQLQALCGYGNPVYLAKLAFPGEISTRLLLWRLVAPYTCCGAANYSAIPIPIY